jgi:hypothetical protein
VATLFHDLHIHGPARVDMIETTETTMHSHGREKDSGIEGRKMETVFHGPQIPDLVRADLIEAPGMEMHFQDSEMVMHSPNSAETPGVAMAFRDRAEDSLIEVVEKAMHFHDPIETLGMATHSRDPTETLGIALLFHDRAEDSLAEAHETKHIHDRAQGPHEPIEEHTKTADRPA